MKGKNSMPFVVLVAAILLVGFLYIKFTQLLENRWQETYLLNDEEPYGGYVIAEVLKNYFDASGLTIIKKPLRYVLDTTASNNNYIFIGNYQHLEYKDQLFLLSFIKNGNNAFIAAHDFHYNFFNHILHPEIPLKDENNFFADTSISNKNQLIIPDTFAQSISQQAIDTLLTFQESTDSNLLIDPNGTITPSIDSSEFAEEFTSTTDSIVAPSFLPDSIPIENDLLVKYFQDSGVTCNFIQPSLQNLNRFPFAYIVNQDSALYDWQYFDTIYVNKSSTTFQPIGKLEKDKINYLSIPYGKGRIYLHSNPILFSNFNLLNENHIHYAEIVFSQLPNSKTFYDEYSKEYNGLSNDFNNSESPLKYIFSQSELKWAYYLIVALLLLFILFRAKRKQKIIPILKSNTNTSLEYVQTIGSLYFQTGEHKKIAIQKMKVFLSQIRSKYKIQTNDLNESFFTQLSLKSKVSLPVIKEIFERYKFIENLSTADEQILIDFYQSIETFYKNRT